MTKDLNIAKKTAENLNVELPVIDKVRSMYEKLCESGYADKDFGVIYKMYEDK